MESHDMKWNANWPKSLPEFIQDFREGILAQREAIDFIKVHKLWKGFWNYGWVSRLLAFSGVLIGLKLFLIINRWWRGAHMDSISETAQSMFNLASNVFNEGYSFLFASSFKYLILVFMEILIFHFLRKTIEIQTGKELHSGFKAFLKAETRMMKVAFLAWILEMVFTVLVNIVLSIIGMELLQWPVLLVVQCYFLGFVMIDNYNELYGMSIRLSEYHTRQYAGVALALGLTTYVMLLIPIIGPVVSPIIAGVAAALLMHRKREEDGFSEDYLLEPSEFV